MALINFRSAQILTSASCRQYKLLDRVRASFQWVWAAESISEKKLVIIKSPFRNDSAEQSRARKELDREMGFLDGKLKGRPGIRQLLDRIPVGSPSEPVDAAVLEYGVTDLCHLHFVEARQLSLPQIKAIAQQLLRGLSSIHGQGIVHTDLKPENIVFTHLKSGYSPDLEVKLIDFGLASSVNEAWRDQVTNPYWRSPESWIGLPLQTSAEIWAFGAIIGSLLLEPKAVLFNPPGGPKYLDQEGIDNYVRTLHTMFPFPQSFLQRTPEWFRNRVEDYKKSPKVMPDGTPATGEFIQKAFAVQHEDWAFIQDVLKIDPNERPSADELLGHPWLRPFPWYHRRRRRVLLKLGVLKITQYLMHRMIALGRIFSGKSRKKRSEVGKKE